MGVFLDDFKQIVIQVLEDQMDQTLLLEGFLQFNDVLVPESSKHFDLAGCRLADEVVSVGLLELLDGDADAGVLAAGFEHHPVSALSYQVHHLIVIH